MDTNLFQGELVRLEAPETEISSKLFSKWAQDTEYLRLLDSEPARLWSIAKMKEWLEKHIEKDDPREFLLMIRALQENTLIGAVDLEGIRWHHGDAWVGIGIGERQYWDKGYGSDALRVMMRYTFTELNLHRLTLSVFEYNPRAVRCYQKIGFVEEGRFRKFLKRGGQRWDLIIMGILREEWKKQQEIKNDSLGS